MTPRFRRYYLVLVTMWTFALLAALPVSAQQWIGSGITEPYRDATVSSTVLGTVSALTSREGTFVRKGQVILELDGELQELEAGRRKLIAESKVEVTTAERQLEMKQRDYDSTKKLFDETSSVSEDDLRNKELDLMLAQGEVERLKTAEKREEIEYRIAQSDLDDRKIVAPFDGVIVEYLIEEGENCSPQQPLVRVADTRQVRLVVHLEPSSANKLKTGMSVTVEVDEAAVISRRARVEYISPVVDPSSGLREVKILFDNSDGRVHPGTTGNLVME